MNFNDTYLVQYRLAISKGEIIASRELIMELDRLIEDLSNPRYYYDTSGAYKMIDFIEKCIKPMKLMLWQKAFIEVIYSFKMSETGFDRFKETIVIEEQKTNFKKCRKFKNGKRLKKAFK